MNWAKILWLALFAVFLFAAASTVSLVSLWFALGALAALVISFLGGELWLQGLVFVVVSVVLLFSLRPLARKYFTPKLTRTNVDAVVGTEGIVTEDVDNVAAQGRVKLGSMEWSARSVTGQNIPKGTLVKVQRIEGVKAFVAPAAVSAEVK